MTCPVPIYQHPKELQLFVDKVYKPAQPKRVLAIGTMYGGTLWTWINNNPNLERLASIDLPVPPTDPRHDGVITARNQWSSWTEHLKFSDIKGDSHNMLTYDKVNYEFFDMIFIDGDHSYQGVKQDWLMYKNLLAPNGFVAFHDSQTIVEVKWLCDQLRYQYAHEEFHEEGGMGIFVVYPSLPAPGTSER